MCTCMYKPCMYKGGLYIFQVAGFFYREIFSVGFVALGVWPLIAYKSRSKNQVRYYTSSVYFLTFLLQNFSNI